MNVISAVFLFLGAILIAGGVAVVVLRRRFAHNLSDSDSNSDSGLACGDGRSPVVYAVGVGLMQIAFGLALTVAAAASGSISGGSDFDHILLSDFAGSGVAWKLTSVLLVVSGAGAAGFGLALGIRAWGRRAEWQGAHKLRLPKRHSIAITVGTILLAYGMLALVSGSILFAGSF